MSSALNSPELNETQVDETTLHEVFRPTEQVLDFILQAANVLAEKYDCHPSEFAVRLGIDDTGKLSGNNYIEYDGTRPTPEVTAGDTIIVNDHYHTADDHGDSTKIRVPIPRSF